MVEKPDEVFGLYERYILKNEFENHYDSLSEFVHTKFRQFKLRALKNY
jgi:hypothetical protein